MSSERYFSRRRGGRRERWSCHALSSRCVKISQIFFILIALGGIISGIVLLSRKHISGIAYLTIGILFLINSIVLRYISFRISKSSNEFEERISNTQTSRESSYPQLELSVFSTETPVRFASVRYNETDNEIFQNNYQSTTTFDRNSQNYLDKPTISSRIPQNYLEFPSISSDISQNYLALTPTFNQTSENYLEYHQQPSILSKSIWSYHYHPPRLSESVWKYYRFPAKLSKVSTNYFCQPAKISKIICKYHQNPAKLPGSN